MNETERQYLMAKLWCDMLAGTGKDLRADEVVRLFDERFPPATQPAASDTDEALRRLRALNIQRPERIALLPLAGAWQVITRQDSVGNGPTPLAAVQAAERHYGLSQPEPPVDVAEPKQSLADWMASLCTFVGDTSGSVIELRISSQHMAGDDIHPELRAVIEQRDKKHRTTSEGVE